MAENEACPKCGGMEVRRVVVRYTVPSNVTASDAAGLSDVGAEAGVRCCVRCGHQWAEPATPSERP